MIPEYKVGLEIVRLLIEHLKDNGWNIRRVDDGGERVQTLTTAAALEVVESVDASTLYFVNLDLNDREWVAVIPGNGGDVICDYSICDESFDKTIEEFFKDNSVMELMV